MTSTNPFLSDLPPPYSDSPNTDHRLPPPPLAGAPPPVALLNVPRPPQLRGPSPPPSYDSITPNLSTAAPILPHQATAVRDETAVLAEVLRAHPWRRAWGPRPRTLHAALCGAALLGSHATVRALLAAGAEVRFTSRHAASKSSSAVHEALRGPSPELAAELLDFVASAAGPARAYALLDARDANGCTPLHVAAGAGETELVAGLFERGADVDAVDDLGRSAVLMAARYGRVETVRFLVQIGADLESISEELWAAAGPGAEAELGSYGLVSKLVGDVVEEEMELVGAEQGREAGESSQLFEAEEHSGGVDEGGGRDDSLGVGGALATDDSGENEGVETGKKLDKGKGNTAPATERTRRARTMKKPHRFKVSSAPNAFYGSSQQWMNQPVVSAELVSILSTTLSTAGKAPGRIRRPPPSMWNTPEFVAWKKDCEKLQAEHRAQREKNRVGTARR